MLKFTRKKKEKLQYYDTPSHEDIHPAAGEYAHTCINVEAFCDLRKQGRVKLVGRVRLMEEEFSKQHGRPSLNCSLPDLDPLSSWLTCSCIYIFDSGTPNAMPPLAVGQQFTSIKC